MRAFGGIEQSKEACRDVRRVNVIEHTVQDLRFAARHFARAPMATATMIGSSRSASASAPRCPWSSSRSSAGPVPGIPRRSRSSGSAASIAPRRAVRSAANSRIPSIGNARAATLFSDVAAWTSSDVVLDVGAREPNLLSGAATYVTGTYFRVLGLRPALGAGLPMDANEGDTSPPLVAVISHALWEKHFERSPDVNGRAMKVNGVTVTIVGVAPRRFAGARTGGSQMRVWLPLSARPQVQRTTSTLASHDDARYGLARAPAARLCAPIRQDRPSRRSPHGRRNRRRRGRRASSRPPTSSR